MKKKKLSHLDSTGQARMVDVSRKKVTRRRAVAESIVKLSHDTLALIAGARLPKGDALATARLAGIMAAKRTSEIVPLCHTLLLAHVDVKVQIRTSGVHFIATASCKGETGVEMEAMTAAAVAALTLYDMVKGVEKGATIETIRLLEKTGGKSGTFRIRQAD